MIQVLNPWLLTVAPFGTAKMDLATFQLLLTESGQQALIDAQLLEPTESRFLACYEKLRKQYPPSLAKTALETVLLRIKARSKFTSADKMYFTRESLEQASGDLAAAHRAKRLAPFGTVADLCCGIGGDSLAFARAGLTVLAVDNDPLRQAMLEANAIALGLNKQIQVLAGDVLTICLAKAQAAFADPSRRSGVRRHLDPKDYTPTLASLRKRFTNDFPLAVKIAPGVDWKSIEMLEAEVEFVSVSGELKECVLWFDSMRSISRRATVLPAEETFAADRPVELPSVGPVERYVFDPDPAIVRAGLAGNLAVELGLASLDYRVALFTGSSPRTSPFLTPFAIECSSRFHPDRLREHLRSHHVGRVTFIKRGSEVDTDELTKKLKLNGNEHRVIILTRAQGEETMLIGERA